MVRLNPFAGPRAIVPLTAGLLALGLVPALADAQVVQDPDSARLVLDDLRHFADALLALPSAGTATESVAVLQRQYFDRATPGLRAYIERYAVRPDSLAAIIARRARYYQSLATMSQRVAVLEPKLRAAFTALKRLYPPAVYPPVYFLVANCGAGGTTRPEGLLIAAEIYGCANGVPADEGPDAGLAAEPTRNLPYLVAHELVHYQQAGAQGLEAYRAVFGERRSLLALAIREGSADFLGELISGGNINSTAKEYGLKNEGTLWVEFAREMRGRETGDWLFVRPKRPGWPQDLGYFMGYRIVQAYYQSHADRAAALRAILGVRDYETFLRDSGYAGRF